MNLGKIRVGGRHSRLDEIKNWAWRRSGENIVNCYEEKSGCAGQELGRIQTGNEGRPLTQQHRQASHPVGRRCCYRWAAADFSVLFPQTSK